MRLPLNRQRAVRDFFTHEAQRLGPSVQRAGHKAAEHLRGAPLAADDLWVTPRGQHAWGPVAQAVHAAAWDANTPTGQSNSSIATANLVYLCVVLGLVLSYPLYAAGKKIMNLRRRQRANMPDPHNTARLLRPQPVQGATGQDIAMVPRPALCAPPQIHDPSEVPKRLRCALTAQLVEDAVRAPNGTLYSRGWIEAFLRDIPYRPGSLVPMTPAQLRPDPRVQREADAWRQTHIIRPIWEEQA